MATWSSSVSIVGESPFRKVVATRPLSRGDTILRETPTLTLLHPKQWGVRCHLCFSKQTATTSSKLLRCSRCRRFWYCSKHCQRHDWKVHKAECTALSSSLQNCHGMDAHGELLADALLVARLLRLKETNVLQYNTVMDLVFHKECIQPTHYQIAKLIRKLGLLNHTDETNTGKDTTSTIHNKNSKQSTAITDEKIVELLARFDSNNFGIVDELLFFLGAGIYPAGAILNHSCDHNCAIRYEPYTHTQVICCITDVQAGQELCHPYIDFASTSTERRQKLQKTYGFDCQCSRCKDPNGTWAQADQWLTGLALSGGINDKSVADSVIAQSEQWLQQAAMTDDIEKELGLVQQCVAARAKVLHPRHLSLYLARSQLHTTSMAAGKLVIARDQCAEIVETMEKCFYRPQHPLIGIMQYTLGSLHHSLNCYWLAIECYEKAYPILECYHGPHHPLTVGCQDYLEQARHEAAANATL